GRADSLNICLIERRLVLHPAILSQHATGYVERMSVAVLRRRLFKLGASMQVAMICKLCRLVVAIETEATKVALLYPALIRQSLVLRLEVPVRRKDINHLSARLLRDLLRVRQSDEASQLVVFQLESVAQDIQASLVLLCVLRVELFKDAELVCENQSFFSVQLNFWH